RFPPVGRPGARPAPGLPHLCGRRGPQDLQGRQYLRRARVIRRPAQMAGRLERRGPGPIQDVAFSIQPKEFTAEGAKDAEKRKRASEDLRSRFALFYSGISASLQSNLLPKHGKTRHKWFRG